MIRPSDWLLAAVFSVAVGASAAGMDPDSPVDHQHTADEVADLDRVQLVAQLQADRAAHPSAGQPPRRRHASVKEGSQQ